MKKPRKKLIVTAAMIAATLGIEACAPTEVQDVYGPPVDYEEPTPDDPVENVYGPPTDLEESVPETVQEVYGPPIY